MNLMKKFLIKKGIKDRIKALKEVQALERVKTLLLWVLNFFTKLLLIN